MSCGPSSQDRNDEDHQGQGRHRRAQDDEGQLGGLNPEITDKEWNQGPVL